jgi:hypothetical protein
VHALALLTVAGLATCAFNPILLQPPMAYLLWSSLGLLIGLALRREAVPAGLRRTHHVGDGAPVREAR